MVTIVPVAILNPSCISCIPAFYLFNGHPDPRIDGDPYIRCPAHGSVEMGMVRFPVFDDGAGGDHVVGIGLGIIGQVFPSNIHIKFLKMP